MRWCSVQSDRLKRWLLTVDQLASAADDDQFAGLQSAVQLHTIFPEMGDLDWPGDDFAILDDAD